MVIGNQNKKYLVLRECESTGEVTQYICSDFNGGGGQRYRIARQKSADVSDKQVRFLMDQMTNKDFSDFYDFFLDGPWLYIVTRLQLGIPLQQKLEESCSLQERMELGKNLLERLLLQNMPPYFIHAAIHQEGILVSPAGEIFFAYDLSDIGQFQGVTQQNGFRQIGRIFRLLFAEELRLRQLPELETLTNSLQFDGMQSLTEIYKNYLFTYRNYGDQDPQQLEPDNFLFRSWKVLFSFLQSLKKLAMPLLVLLALGYLIISLISFFEEPAVKQQFTRVGTVSLTEPYSESAEETTTGEERP